VSQQTIYNNTVGDLNTIITSSAENSELFLEVVDHRNPTSPLSPPSPSSRSQCTVLSCDVGQTIFVNTHPFGGGDGVRASPSIPLVWQQLWGTRDTFTSCVVLLAVLVVAAAESRETRYSTRASDSTHQQHFLRNKTAV
jgi:hypothetical protein